MSGLLAYTDGSTWKKNPGPMSWAVVFVRDDVVATDTFGADRVLVGASGHGTNNRAELMGVITALEHETGEDLTILTDSLVTLRCATGLYQRHANRDLWERFDRALDLRKMRGLATSFRHVKGHNGNKYNNMADRLASEHAESIAQETLSQQS